MNEKNTLRRSIRRKEQEKIRKRKLIERCIERKQKDDTSPVVIQYSNKLSTARSRNKLTPRQISPTRQKKTQRILIKRSSEISLECRKPYLPLTILFHSRNISTDLFSKSLSDLKESVKNIQYNLHILEGYIDNYPKTFNKFFSKDEYLVICNEFCSFPVGWLDHMLDEIEMFSDIGLVVCQTNSSMCDYPSCAVSFSNESFIEKTQKITRPISIPAQYLSCWLIRSNDVLFDDQYSQFFYDLAFCRDVWKSGKRVVTVPDIILNREKINLEDESDEIQNCFCENLKRLTDTWQSDYSELYNDLAKEYPETFSNALDVSKIPRRIVYTVCTGKYDTVAPVRFPEPNTRYILFTDGPAVTGWEKIFWSGGRRESREPKILPHKHLPDHDESLYIDACIKLTKPPSELFKLLESDFAACAHPNDFTFIDHCKKMIDGEFSDEALINEQIERYTKDGFKDVGPLTENTLLLRKNTPLCARINEEWWYEYCKGSSRDQLSLPYVFFKLKINPQILNFRSRINQYYSGWWDHNWRKTNNPRSEEANRVYKYKPLGKTGKILMATVVSGDKFQRLYNLTRPFHENYAKRHGMDYKVITAPSRKWPSPSWWKLDLIDELKKYDAVFFCDADAIPKPGSPNIVNQVPYGKFGAFNSMLLPYMSDDHGSTMTSWINWLKASKKPVNIYEPKKIGYYINGGVWVCYRDAASILSCKNPVEIDHFFEQHQICWNLYMHSYLYHELKWCWNCGHPHLNLNRMKGNDIHIVHLNGPGDKISVFRDMMTWPCFNRKV